MSCSTLKIRISNTNENGHKLHGAYHASRNLAAGQLSGEVFKISETEVFTVSKHKDKASADKVMRLMQEELKEIAEGSKITKMEGQILIDA